MPVPTEAGTSLGSSARPLHEVYDAGLLDLDGVLYRGQDPVEHAADSVAAARAAGMRIAYVTNNASRHPEAVAEHLTELGIPTSPHEVVTSAQAAVRLAASQVPAGSAALVLGTVALAEAAAAAGLRPVRTVAEAGPAGVSVVLQGLAPETSLADLCEATVALRSGALWIAGNADLTLPSPRGLLPGNGSFVQVLRAVTGLEPRIAGKPDPALHGESVERVGARRPLVVGDRLDTDVLGAVRGGADSLLVLTGVTDVTGLLAAPRGSRPTFVGSDLRALGLAHPEVKVEEDLQSAMCRDARAEVTEAGITVTEAGIRGGAGAGDDGVRAVAALAWARADVGLSSRLA